MKVKTASRLDKSIALAAIVLLGAQRQALPKALWLWVEQNAPWVTILLLFVAGLFSLAPFVSRAESKIAKRRTSLQRQILSRLGSILSKIESEIPGFDHTDLGLHIWRVRRPLLKPWDPRLERVATYRLGGSVNLRKFNPRKGEGVSGLAWKYNREYTVDVSALRDKLHTEEEFKHFAAENPGDSVMNMSWETFISVRHRGAVASSPIRDRSGNFRGCVSVDTSEHHDVLERVALPELNAMAEILSDHQFEEM